LSDKELNQSYLVLLLLEKKKKKEKEKTKKRKKTALNKETYQKASGEWIRTIDLRVMSPTSYRAALPRPFL
jgi:hypothetical protein